MSLIETVMTALGGEFTTTKTARSSYQSNGTHTVRRLRNGNVQVELHSLKNGTNINFITKGRLGAAAYRALTEAGVAEDDISVSDGSFDNRNNQQNVWKPWPSLYVQGSATTSDSAGGSKRVEALESDMGDIKSMLTQLLGAKASPEAPTSDGDDADGDGPVAEEPANADF